ncbi:hypothetical protein ABBQ32_010038 [Trebouxia sp. C0010 RCD-2024]
MSRVAWTINTIVLAVLSSESLPANGVESPHKAQPGEEGYAQLYAMLQAEVNTHICALGQVSDTTGSLERTFMSPAHQASRAQIESWMQEAGMRTWTDAVANIHGKIDGQNPEHPVLLIGSHYDTVKDAGKYDGALGILVGIAAVKALVVQRAQEAGVLTSQQADAAASGAVSVPNLLDIVAVNSLFTDPVEVVAFSDEEGIRFSTTLLGSRALVGTLVQPHNLLLQQGRDGLTVQQVLQQNGLDPTPQAIAAIAMKSRQVRAYVEVHLEQGPVLEASNKPLGVVSAIAGQTRLTVSMIGTQGHAGTVPMGIRRDPLAAAAEAISSVEQRCQGGKLNVRAEEAGEEEEQASRGRGSDPSLVCTVGSISVWPGASNVIPGSANFSVDIRAQYDSVRSAVVLDVINQVEKLCERRHLTCLVQRVHDAGAVQCSPALVEALTAAVKESEEVYSKMQWAAGAQERLSAKPRAQQTLEDGKIPVPVRPSASHGDEDQQCKASQPNDVPVLVSGAGHDSLAMAELTQIGMVFVRCHGGISHSPLEHVSDEDVGRATAALHTYLRRTV